MRVSIALASFNGARYLAEQLESFVNQDRQPDELIVSDDASTDGTAAVVEEFAKSAPFEVKLLSNDINIGHELNFERAIAACSGDLVFMSDQDDVWFSSKIAKVVQLFKDRPQTSIVINDLEITDEGLKPSGRNVVQQMRVSGIWAESGKTFVTGCATAFRSELRDLFLPIPPLRYGHDRWLHAIGHAIGGRFVLETSLQYFRRHGSNASTWLFDAPSMPGMTDMLHWSAGVDMSGVYNNQREVLRTIALRLCDQPDEIYRGTRPKVQVLTDLRAADVAFTRRIALLNSKPATRKLKAVRMLIARDYRYFLGLRSFAKDMVR